MSNSKEGEQLERYLCVRIKYEDGEEDHLRTSHVPFTLNDLLAASGTREYYYTEHDGQKMKATVDTDKVIDLLEVKQPPFPPPPTM